MPNSAYRMGAVVLILSLFTLPSPLYSFTRMSARVTDSRTGEGIVMVNILVLDTSQGTVTDAEGRFNLILKSGQSLQLRHIAYQELTHVVQADDLAKGAFLGLSLEPKFLLGEQVFVSATRGREDLTPVAFSTLTQQDWSTVTVEDVPMALSALPGVYAFSDAGNGVGYTYLKIRGFDQDRIGVMINGIPLNDPESHQVYWVDHGDILAGSGSVQVQRGVGSSLYGTAAFGGSVNLVTSPRAMPEGLIVTTGYGDFTDTGFSAPSRILTLKWSGQQPLAGRPLALYGRYSGIRSDGYRLGSGTVQDAFHIIGEYLQPEASTRLELLSGSEVTHFSWDGIIPFYGYDLDDRQDRRYNFYADPYFNGGRTNANKDVFTQNIASVQHARQLGGGILSLSLYGITGRGYYEQFKGGVNLWEYNLDSLLPRTAIGADLMRRKWLVNGYWGVIPQYILRRAWGLTVLGGDFRRYSADHYGRVRSIEEMALLPSEGRREQWRTTTTIDDIGEPVEYYRYATAKTSLSLYAHSLLRVTTALTVMGDLKLTAHRYAFDQHAKGAYTEPYDYTLRYLFVDPRVGLRYRLSEHMSTFVNLSRAQREPADSDIYDADNPWAVPALEGAPTVRKDLDTPLVQAEELWDLEVGWRYYSPRTNITTNLYSMWFRDELIPLDYRTITDDGVPTHGNADLTVHRGLEVEISQQLTDQLALDGSLTMADNRFVDYTTFEWQPDLDKDGEINHADNRIPGHPARLAWIRLLWTSGPLDLWTEARYVGKIYIDRQNTETAAIAPSIIVDLGLAFRAPIPAGWPVSAVEIRLKVNNALDNLYETFGYNYWDGDNGSHQVDVYWPAASRGYFMGLNIRF